MTVAGGTWTNQNKIRPGVYIRFTSSRGLGLTVPRTRICGGGAKSPAWRQITADILRMPVESIAVEEGPGLGAAMLAAVACGEYADAAEAADAIVRVSSVTEPDMAAADRYDAAYARFRRLYPAVRSVLAD